MAKWIRPPPTAAEASGEAAKQPGEPLPSLPGIDAKARLAIAQGRTALYRRLLKRFQESEADFAERFATAVASDDMETATRHAHSLKGVAGNIGAHELRDAAAELELALADAGAPDPIEQRLSVTIQQLDRVLTGLALADDSSAEPAPETPVGGSADRGHGD